MPGYETTTQFYGGGWDAAYDQYYPEDRETTMSRFENLGVTTALTSGTVSYNYFVARRPRTVTGAAFYVSTTAAATVTTIKYGLYEENPTDGALTLRAITANDTALLAAADTRYFKAFTSSWALKAGRRYAVALIVVATTTPTLVGLPAVGATFDASVAAIYSQAPKRAANFAAQTDLVAAVTGVQAASYAALPILAYAEVGTA